MYSYGPPHMAVQKQDDQLELTYSNYVRTQDVTLKTCRRRWVIGRSGESGSGVSVLAARHDDDDDDICVCRSIPCLHLVNVLSLWYFCRESLLLLRFLLLGRMLVGFVPSSLCVWNRRPWWSRQIGMSPVGFLPERLQGFYGWSKFVRL